MRRQRARPPPPSCGASGEGGEGREGPRAAAAPEGRCPNGTGAAAPFLPRSGLIPVGPPEAGRAGGPRGRWPVLWCAAPCARLVLAAEPREEQPAQAGQKVSRAGKSPRSLLVVREKSGFVWVFGFWVVSFFLVVVCGVGTVLRLR